MLVFENKFLRIADRIYGTIVKIGSNLQSTYLLYLRFVWGHQLFLHGLQKFTHSETVIHFFNHLEFQHPGFILYIVAFFETVGGLCLFLGFMSRLAAIPVIIIMISALFFAHPESLSGWHLLLEPNILIRQDPYPFLVTSLIIFIFGPGRVSIDAWLKRWSQKQPKY